MQEVINGSTLKKLFVSLSRSNSGEAIDVDNIV